MRKPNLFNPAKEVSGHLITVDEVLKADCTIRFGGMSGAIAAAAEYAR